MQVERYEDQGTTVYKMQGRLDAHQVPALKSLIEVVPPGIVLDLVGVNFIDSTGLAFLVGVNKRARESKIGLKLRNLQDPVRLILEMVGLYDILPIER